MRIKRAIALLGLLSLAALSFGQQITRVAVVDLPKIVAACSNRSSQKVRDFELHKSQAQTELDRMSAEIVRLMAQKDSADKAGNAAESLRLESTISAKTKDLQSLKNTRSAELDAEAMRLNTTDDFTKDLYKQIQNVAETEGYSLVINWKNDKMMDFVLWYSPMIDITADVIEALTKP